MTGKKHTKSDPLQSREKVRAYLNALASEQEFLAHVAEIRRKFNLPQNGLEENVPDIDAFIEEIPPLTEETVDTFFNQDPPLKCKTVISDFRGEIHTLADKYNLVDFWIDDVIDFVLYNEFFPKKIKPHIQVIDLQEFVDDDHTLPKEFIMEHDLSDDFLEETPAEALQRDLRGLTKPLPVIIAFSPTATGNDIIDYVKKRYVEKIKPLQKKYEAESPQIGKIRKRNDTIRERDAFICENKNLSGEKLASLVNKKYSCNLGYTYVNRIIARKCRRGQ